MPKALVLREDNSRDEVSCARKPFQQDIKQGQAILVFVKANCEPCQELLANLSAIDQEIPASFYIVDTEECSALSDRFKVKMTPTVVITQNGKEVLRHEGQTRIGLDV